MDYEGKSEDRINQARIIAAWMAAGKRVEAEDQTGATQIASGLFRSLIRGEHIELRKLVHKDINRKLKDTHYPHYKYLDAKFEEIDEGDITAEPLPKVISKDIDVDYVRSTVPDRAGNLKVKNVATKTVPLPNETEELRDRVNLLGLSYIAARLRKKNVHWLVDADEEIWRQHLGHILGLEIAGLKVDGPNGEIFAPEWSNVLSYQHQIRKEACRLIMLEGKALGEALQTARGDSHLRQIHFDNPMTHQIAQGRPAQRMNGYPSNPGVPGNGKGFEGQNWIGQKGAGVKQGWKNQGQYNQGQWGGLVTKRVPRATKIGLPQREKVSTQLLTP